MENHQRNFKVSGELHRALAGHRTVFTQVIPDELIPIVQQRISYGLEIVRPLRVKNWFNLNERDYEKLVLKRKQLFDNCRNIGGEEKARLYELNHIESYEPHITLVTATAFELSRYKKFRNLFPKGTTLEFIMAQAEIHDLSRELVNGSHLPLWFIDYASDELVERIFPDFPNLFHTIDWNFGIKEPNVKKDAVALIYGALDTFCKPGISNVSTFFEPGGAYEKWKKKVENLFPMSVPLGDNKYKEVTLEEYCANDRRFTEMGMELIGQIIDGDPYLFIQQMIDLYNKSAAHNFKEPDIELPFKYSLLHDGETNN